MTPYAIALIEGPEGPLAVMEYEAMLFALADILPDLAPSAASGGSDLHGHWGELTAAIAAALAGGNLPPPCGEAAYATYLAPVRSPANIICAGSNYYDHLLKDFRITSFDKAGNDILYFTKPTGALVGSGGTVRYPSQSAAFDWEIELVVVIGKRGRRIPPGEALSHVAGYTIGLDLTARDLQFNKRQRRQFDLFGGKGFDDSAPVGPGIVPAHFIDPEDLGLKLWVNGALKQDSHTREMIWSVTELVADVSQHVTLQPGDLLFTGSPAGVGHASGTYLKPGDRIDAEITGLGRLTVDIVPDPDGARVWNRQSLLASDAARKAP